MKNISILVLVILSISLFTGCMFKTTADTSPNKQVVSNADDSSTSKFLDDFKNVYNSKSDDIKSFFDPSISDSVTYALIKKAFVYESIDSIKIISVSDDGKIVSTSINGDAKPTTFTFSVIDGKKYITNFKSGLTLMDYASAKGKDSCCTIMQSPILSPEGSLSVTLKNNRGSIVKDFKVLSGTGNCASQSQQSANFEEISNGNDANLVVKCSPKVKGENFITELVVGYLDVTANSQKTFNISVGIYDR